MGGDGCVVDIDRWELDREPSDCAVDSIDQL